MATYNLELNDHINTNDIENGTLALYLPHTAEIPEYDKDSYEITLEGVIEFVESNLKKKQRGYFMDAVSLAKTDL